MIARRTFLVAAPAAALPRQDDVLRSKTLAQRAIRRLQARADRLLRGQGLREGAVGDRLARLFEDERHLYPDSEAGRDQAVANMNARLAQLRPHLARAFGDLPIPPAEARRMNAADQAAGRAGYRVAGDMHKPGAYHVDLAHIRRRPKWTLPSVAFHEVIPGHLMQIPLQPPGVKEPEPFFEGWAIYAEQLALDLGAYAHDPLGEIGYIHWRLFRLARVAVDCMLQLGSSREAAISAMGRLQGPPIAFITIEADVERFIASPGKAAREGLAALTLAARRPTSVSQWPAYHRRILTGPAWSG